MSQFFSGEDWALIIEISGTGNSYFICDRVCTQSKKLKRVPVSVLIWKNVGWKMVSNFLVKDEKTEKSTYIRSECPYSIRISVQCIQAKTT